MFPEKIKVMKNLYDSDDFEKIVDMQDIISSDDLPEPMYKKDDILIKKEPLHNYMVYTPQESLSPLVKNIYLTENSYKIWISKGVIEEVI